MVFVVELASKMGIENLRGAEWHKRYKDRKYPTIVCQHCGKEALSNGSKQKYHPECNLQVRAIRRKKRYRKDSEFRRRTIEANKKSEERRFRGETRPRDPISIERWRITKIANELAVAGEKLRQKNKKLLPLFVPEGSEVTVFLSPNGYLCFRPGKEAEFIIEPDIALSEYGYREIRKSLKEAFSKNGSGKSH